MKTVAYFFLRATKPSFTANNIFLLPILILTTDKTTTFYIISKYMFDSRIGNHMCNFHINFLLQSIEVLKHLQTHKKISSTSIYLVFCVSFSIWSIQYAFLSYNNDKIQICVSMNIMNIFSLYVFVQFCSTRSCDRTQEKGVVSVVQFFKACNMDVMENRLDFNFDVYQKMNRKNDII